MRQPELFQTFYKNIAILLTKPFIRVIFVLPLFLSIGTCLLIAFFYTQLPPEIPLYYSRPWGNDQLTQPFFLFLLPLGSLFWYLVTLFLIAYQTYQYRVFAQLLLIFSLIVSFLATYTVGMIIILVL